MLALNNWALIADEAVRCNQKKATHKVAFFMMSKVKGQKSKVYCRKSFDLQLWTFDGLLVCKN